MFDEIQPETRSNRLARGDPAGEFRERERFRRGARVRDDVHEVRTEKETGFEPPPEPPAFVSSVRSITNVQSLRRLFHASPSAPARPGAAPASAEMFDERDEMVESSPSRRDDAAGVDDDVRESVLVEESAKESAIGGGEHRARARARGRLGARAGASGGVRDIERVVGRAYAMRSPSATCWRRLGRPRARSPPPRWR